MNIVYASSDSYSGVAAVSIASLFENNRDAAELAIHIIDNGISPENREKLTRLARVYGREITFHPLPDLSGMAGVSLNSGYADVATFASSFLPVILPERLDRVLMIDCDTMVRKSLAELWATDLTGFYIAAVDDVKSKWYRRAIGVADGAPYINSGVILVNLKRCREDDTVGRAIRLLNEKKGELLYMDQAVNNRIYTPMIRMLPMKYNCLTGFLAFDARQMRLYKWPACPFSDEDLHEAAADPVIVHFSDNALLQSRPWIEGCAHPFAEEYRKYRAMTWQKDEPLLPERVSAARWILRAVYRRVPRTALAWALGFLQAELQPRLKQKL